MPDSFFDIRTKVIGDQYSYVTRGFGDTININSAVLNVVTGFESPDPDKNFPSEWTLNSTGVINLIPTGSHTTPTIEGSHLINSGKVAGQGQFLADFTNDGVLDIAFNNQTGRISASASLMKPSSLHWSSSWAARPRRRVTTSFILTRAARSTEALNVSLIDGFFPQLGDTFRIVDGGNSGLIVGQFTSLNLPTLSGITWSVDYEKTFVDLQVTSVPEPTSLVLLTLGAIGLPGRRTRKQRK